MILVVVMINLIIRRKRFSIKFKYMQATPPKP